eukprot:GHVT01061170.1.p1 GENE.GHVT01061170.1~~GHVT01061170.1.p1  ORF type:complete len:153 (+),score=14.35 GHVT01061170.1:585-1043(+)
MSPKALLDTGLIDKTRAQIATRLKSQKSRNQSVVDNTGRITYTMEPRTSYAANLNRLRLNVGVWTPKEAQQLEEAMNMAQSDVASAIAQLHIVHGRTAAHKSNTDCKHSGAHKNGNRWGKREEQILNYAKVALPRPAPQLELALQRRWFLEH